ncbi:MAG: carbamoyltransferase [Dolichospermum sp. JUN01]|jgi:carbamoyltransferase|nr:carbamoyltransferase [Dolichospermum sp. JUN01]QSV52970.1 MAG: carbamoyltransferase [Dolichospermum sp. UKL201]
MASSVLGISAFYHDSAAALIKDGDIVAAAQEERFSRIRHDSSFPKQAIQYCLDEAGISLDDVTTVVYYEDSKVKFSRVVWSFANAGLPGLGKFVQILPDWIKWKRNVLVRVKQELLSIGRGNVPKIVASQHHRSHAASAFFPSPFESAAVLCIDGVGEWQTTSIWHGQGNSLELVNSVSYPHSLGLLYSSFTYYCGFKVDSGEYKLMGLAPYGQPIYANKIRDELINIQPDGSFTLNLEYFEFLRGEKMVGAKFEKLFGYPVRTSESSLLQHHCDLAASVQKVTEEVVLGLAKMAIKQTGERNLCMAGGVALNCVANGVLSRSEEFNSIWIQPAAGDAGCAIGAAFDVVVAQEGRKHLSRKSDAMQGSLLGPSYSDTEIRKFLTENQYPFEYYEEDALYENVAEYLANDAVVGWFQGRMEFGPRALGSRSIIGDPRDPQMQRKMNLKIKFRESFRPFAPVVLLEDALHYFDIKQESPYMLFVFQVADRITSEALRVLGSANTSLGSINEVRSELPAITHIDLSARVQTVTEQTNRPFTRLLQNFKQKTGCSVLINTSFNVRGEPIVCTPEQAYTCFMRTEIDVLVLGSFVLKRTNQPVLVEEVDWRTQIPLD